MEYEIINPSDKAYISGNDLKRVCVATIILGDGLYGLSMKDGHNIMPVVRFAKNWFKEKFDQPIADAIEECIQREDFYKIFESVRLDSERTSLNDIVGRAKNLAKMVKRK